MKILLIDDNPDICELMQTVLEPEGHDFTSVNNGRDGLKLMQEQKFGVVFLDLAMPVMSGKEVVAELIKNGLIKKQIIILFTASSFTEEDIDEMIKQGVYFCMRKPIQIDNLYSILEKISTICEL